MKPPIAFVLLLVSCASCFAGRCDDLMRLCDLSEAYFRAEARVVSSSDKSLDEYAHLVLAMRIHALTTQRARLAALEKHEAEKIVVNVGGRCGFTVGKDPFPYPLGAEDVALRDYVARHDGVMRKYDELVEAEDARILKEPGVDRKEWHAILKRYVPNLDED